MTLLVDYVQIPSVIGMISISERFVVYSIYGRNEIVREDDLTDGMEEQYDLEISEGRFPSGT